MEINLTTPALLFPAISLILLAYTNRFLSIANLARALYVQYQDHPTKIIAGQIKNLRRRLKIIRRMQAFGIGSLLLCVCCMFLFFAGFVLIAEYIFGAGLILLMISLILSLQEIMMSIHALDIQLSDMELPKNDLKIDTKKDI